MKRLRPEVRIIGVNTVDSDSMTQSLKTGHPVALEECGLFSDGSAVRLVGKETFRLCQKYVDDMVLVTNDEICAAIRDTFGDTRSIVEPAGALVNIFFTFFFLFFSLRLSCCSYDMIF